MLCKFTFQFYKIKTFKVFNITNHNKDFYIMKYYNAAVFSYKYVKQRKLHDKKL